MTKDVGLEKRAIAWKLRREALKVANQSGASRKQSARERGLHPNILDRWVLAHEAGKWEVAGGNLLMTNAERMIERLHRERAKVQAEQRVMREKGGRPLRHGIQTNYGFLACPQSISPARTICRATRDLA